MDTFVDPSDDAALARLFNYPLTSNQLIPSDLKKTYTKLYNAHVGAFAEQVEARKELERVKAGNKELRKRIGRTVDKTEQLLVVLQELKDEEVVEIREMETEVSDVEKWGGE